MATITRTKLGPADHGRSLSLEEFESGDFELGFRYELINGRLYVSPPPDPPENLAETWLRRLLERYADEHPEVINYVTSRARVFVADRPETTCPEPDISAYADFPVDAPWRGLRWQDFHPVLVVEVMTGDVWKDMRRNVELYLENSSIREYWVLDARRDAEQPVLIQHVRRGKRWVVREYAYGSTLTTKLLPGFKLVIDPRTKQ